MGSHHQKLVVLRHDEDAGEGRRVRRRDRPLLRPPRRRRPPRRPAAAADVGGLRARTRPGTTCSCRSAGRRSACSTPCSASAGTTRTAPTQDHPIAWIHDKLHGTPGCTPTRCRRQLPPPPECGPHYVQNLRTYPAIRPPYDFAPDGERSVARGYSKAIKRARRLIYLEDQYMWSAEVARLFAEALTAHPDLHLVVVVPRVPDQEGAIAERPQNWSAGGRRSRCASRPARTGCTCSTWRTTTGTPVYVHAKVCVVDDVWASVGSDNFNRRSWTHDSELSSGGAGHHAGRAGAARPGGHRRRRPRLRPRPAAGAGAGAPGPARRRQRGRRPARPGALRRGDAPRAPTRSTRGTTAAGRARARPAGCGRTGPSGCRWLTRLWATPLYRLVDDPDGRPLRLRLKGEF